MKEIAALILEKLRPFLHVPEEDVKFFLEKLMDGELKENRLLCCLGIDVKNDLIDLQKLAKIFDKIDYEGAKKDKQFAVHFEAVLSNNLDLHHYSNEANASKSLNIKWSRVMTSKTFKEHFYNKITNIDDVKSYWDDIRKDIERNNLEQVNMPNNGAPFRRLVWTVPLTDIVKLADPDTTPDKDWANKVTDCLGLDVNPSASEYIYIEYDENFDEPLYQPSTINNNWNWDSFYLSYKRDTFGQTRPRTGDEPAQRRREKVHEPIDHADYAYNIKYLGNVTTFDSDTSNFIDEALERYRL